MAATTGIAWTDATANFWIGCTKVGDGCLGCYAEVFADRKFNIKFGPGERRMRTKAGYENPLRWQRMHDRGQTTMRENHSDIPVPRWVFCNSLSDFFDNEIPEQWRTDAWKVIRETPALRWQIVTKRVGNAHRMLPADWGDMKDYRNVGIIATMVNQEEVDRDMPKLAGLVKLYGVRWIGLSIEPQLGPITLWRWLNCLDWVIIGGESNQGAHKARPFDLLWAKRLIDECTSAKVPVFMKQMGDNRMTDGLPMKLYRKMRDSGTRVEDWPLPYRVQQMPRVFDLDPPYQPRNLPRAAPKALAAEPKLI